MGYKPMRLDEGPVGAGIKKRRRLMSEPWDLLTLRGLKDKEEAGKEAESCSQRDRKGRVPQKSKEGEERVPCQVPLMGQDEDS